MLTKKDINIIRQVVNEEIVSELKPIRKKINKIDKKLDKTIDFFDVHELKLVEEVRIIQKHVGLPIMEFA
jgi:predicted mannosyl-3-phosphoglycerate phosphatase (HAD superfamily)